MTEEMEKIKTTKYFGEVELVPDHQGRGCAEVKATLNGQKVRLTMWDCKDIEGIERNLPYFWSVVDKYAEIKETANKAIVDYYDNDKEGTINGNGNIKYFFSMVFTYADEEELIEIFGVKDFEQFDIKTYIDKIPYPNITIYFESEIKIFINYELSDSEHWENYCLVVKMDKDLNITGFLAVLD